MRHTYFLFSFWCLLLHFGYAFSTPSNTNHNRNIKPIPITVISGFLGSGKTTLLKNMLENKKGIKIAVIVNDVASVNIDSKLVSGSNSADGMVQLENGCACCSLAEELLGSVSELVTMSDIRDESDAFDHIVIELSGVADPKGVRSQFQEATFYNMPIMERVCLDTMVTVVDCSVFLRHLQSSKAANIKETPELYLLEGEEIPEEPEEGNWMESVPSPLLEALLAGDENASPNPFMQQSDNAVADLLISQSETADVVLLNKVDLVDNSEDVETISQILSALNPNAKVQRTSYAEIPLESVLAVAGGMGVVASGVVDDHRDAVKAAEQSFEIEATGTDNDNCDDPDCVDTSHSHTHDHNHECKDEDCTDTSHSHNHDDHQATTDSHSHDHSHDTACNDPGCTDTSHSHTHDHQQSSTLDQLGIGSFVYRARKPFHPQRLAAFLRCLPISRGLPEQNDNEKPIQSFQDATLALGTVVRSKGFLWLADSHVAANYWSHSGSSFEMQCLGRWWSTLPRPQWPPEAAATILSDFDDPDHDEADLSSDSVGDRRQEIVFIGAGLSNKDKQTCIVSSLNQCLLNDAEWAQYSEKKMDEGALRSSFANTFSTKMLTY